MAKVLEIGLDLDDSRYRAAQARMLAAGRARDDAIRRSLRAEEDALSRVARRYEDSARVMTTAAQRAERARERVAEDSARRRIRIEEDASQQIQRVNEDAARATQEGWSSGLAGIVSAGAGLAAIIGITRSFTDEMAKATEKQREFAREGIEFQDKLRMTAFTMGRTDLGGVAKDAGKFLVETGLKPDEGIAFLENYAGAAASYEKNMAPGEAEKLRTMVGKNVRALGGGVGFAEDQAMLVAGLMSEEAEGKGTAKGVFARLDALNRIIGGSEAPTPILSRELKQAGTELVAGGYGTYEDAAALIAGAGAGGGGVAGTNVSAAIRSIVQHPEAAIFKKAGITPEMGGVEAIQAVLEQLRIADEAGIKPSIALSEGGIKTVEERRGFLALYKGRQAMEKGLGPEFARPTEPEAKAKAEAEAQARLEATHKESIGTQLQIEKNKLAQIEMEKNQRKQAYEFEEARAIEQLAGEGRGEADVGAVSERFWSGSPLAMLKDLPGALGFGAGKGIVEGNYQREILARMGKNLGVERDYTGVSLGDPLLYEDLAGAANEKQLTGKGGLSEEELAKQTKLLEEQLQALKALGGGSGGTGKGSAPLGPATRPISPAGPAPGTMR